MKCKSCGIELSDNQAFCTYCGTPVEKEETVTVKDEILVDGVPVADPEQEKANGMAKVGLILGIVSVAANFICCGSPIPCILGIIFSIMGKKATDPERRKMANAGLVLSIVGIGLTMLTTIISIAVQITEFIIGSAMI